MIRAAALLAALLAPLSAAAQDADARARDLMRAHGCPACHVVPGLVGPGGVTGPPLTGMYRQVYVAGVAPNTLGALTEFLLDPQALDPRSAMPDTGLTPDEAETIAAFLYRATATP